MNKRIKLTIIFRNTSQTGNNHYTDWATTKTIFLTEEQTKSFIDTQGKWFSEVIAETVEEESE